MAVVIRYQAGCVAMADVAYDADGNYNRTVKFGALRFNVRFETTHSHYVSPQNGLIYSVAWGIVKSAA